MAGKIGNGSGWVGGSRFGEYKQVVPNLVLSCIAGFSCQVNVPGGFHQAEVRLSMMVDRLLSFRTHHERRLAGTTAART